MEKAETRKEQPEESLKEVTIAEKPQKDWLKIILFSLLGLLVLAGAIYGGYWYAARKKVPPTPTPIPQLTPTPSVEEQTKDWKVYRNQDYGFQIKYPPELALGPEPQAPDSELLSSRSLSPPSEEWSVVIAVRSTPLDVLVAAEEALSASSATQISVGELKAKKLEWVNRGRPDLGVTLNRYEQKVFIAHNDLSYIMSFYVDNDSNLKNAALQKFDLMLQTFKFTGDETVGWTVFRNEEAETKYSLKYPQGWIISREHKDLEGEARQAYDSSILTKGGYKISIMQAMGSSASCLYPGEPDKEGMYARYGDYVELEVGGCVLRRAKSTGSLSNRYVFCEKKGDEFVGTTTFGVIYYEVPEEESAAVIAEMDSIIKTLTLIK